MVAKTGEGKTEPHPLLSSLTARRAAVKSSSKDDDQSPGQPGKSD